MTSQEISKDVFSYCTDTSDAKILSAAYQLFLKPVARLNISVQIPELKITGKSLSNYEVIEKIKYWAQPEEFSSLKVTKSTLEFVRLDGEIENRSKLLPVLARLDGRTIKLSGFADGLRVRATEAKPDFPTRHDWDSYFRDAKNMNEMKPGERPDTIYLSNLPVKWFSTKARPNQPSEAMLRRVFQNYGDIREVDIPINDPYRAQMKPYISGMTLFSHAQSLIFEAYVQFKEYVHFVKAMDALRGMKLLHVDGDKAYCANVKVSVEYTLFQVVRMVSAKYTLFCGVVTTTQN
ncbi:A-kinase anchor protein 17A-like [Diaphorina citri]|uniref:A-kinase anchor protein 17A-like n=1 Tax=Diaphorina citri TaxID=121845 RepID=A0A3Q0ILL8_DIACI|nr:A-kinase anchor protein 17A-like [Diaphorina citri]XP_026677092.1 A-kinase anchor protein 17A-like [Diaphorina citri]